MKVEHQEDFNLVHNYLLGDEGAGERLYLRVIPLLRKFVYKKTSGSSLAFDKKEEIIADTLKKSIEKLETFTGSSSFTTFVFGFANNYIKRAFTAVSKELKMVPIDAFIELEESIDNSFEIDLQQYSKNPLHIILEKEKTEALKETLEKLPPEYQQIIQMRLYNKTPVKEVAQITGKTEKAIDSLYRRAIRKLHDVYVQNYEFATEKSQ